MMEIKFRAWDNTNKRMLGPFARIEWHDEYNLAYFADGALDVPCDNLIWEQYTGLHDKNGKECFDADVITEGTRRYRIEWSEEELTWILTNPTIRGHLRLADINSRIWWTVGNIHESPELLNG